MGQHLCEIGRQMNIYNRGIERDDSQMRITSRSICGHKLQINEI